MSLSVIIITKNEEQNMRGCLESASWADEIIVVDSGSNDNTVAICNELGAKALVMDWPGFGPQKNRALALATGDWVLSLDADERVSSELRSEIQSAIANPGDAVAFRVPRSSSYCGRIMRHSGWWPDYVTRLFKRGCARFSDDPVHERLIVEGTTATLRQPLLHEAFRDLEQVLQKLNGYSSAGAVMLLQRGRKATLASAVGHGLWTFIRTYFLHAGFLDGREGFMLAVSNAEGTYYRYLKAMLLAEKQKQ
jgi:glycosyltransferase involved in cell wall biosynthesis